jgi:hypothetical protein
VIVYILTAGADPLAAFNPINRNRNDWWNRILPVPGSVEERYAEIPCGKDHLQGKSQQRGSAI